VHGAYLDEASKAAQGRSPRIADVLGCVEGGMEWRAVADVLGDGSNDRR
jgi:hypothetical protein